MTIEQSQESSFQPEDRNRQRRLNVIGHLFLLVLMAGGLLIVAGFVGFWCLIARESLVDSSQSFVDIDGTGRLVVLLGLPFFAAFVGFIIWVNRRSQAKKRPKPSQSFGQWLCSPLAMYVRSSKVVLLMGLVFAGAGLWIIGGGVANSLTEGRPHPLPFIWGGGVFFLFGAGMVGLMVVRLIQETRGWQANLEADDTD